MKDFPLFGNFIIIIPIIIGVVVGVGGGFTTLAIDSQRSEHLEHGECTCVCLVGVGGWVWWWCVGAGVLEGGASLNGYILLLRCSKYTDVY